MIRTMLNLSKKAGTLRGQVDTFMPTASSAKEAVSGAAGGAGSYLRGAASDMFMRASTGIQMYGADLRHALGAPGRMASALGNAYDNMGRAAWGYGQKLKALPGQMKEEFNAARFAAANPPAPPGPDRMMRPSHGGYPTGGTPAWVRGESPTPPPTPTPTPGAPAVKANAAVDSPNYSGPFTGALAGAHPMAMMAGMAAVGGVTSYATGGNFMQGAVMGGVGGYAGLKGAVAGSRYLSKNYAKGTMRGDVGRGVRGFLKPSIAEGGKSQGAHNQRAAMLAGAGLSGMMFGGNRRSHKRGFNSRRGNGF